MWVIRGPWEQGVRHGGTCKGAEQGEGQRAMGSGEPEKRLRGGVVARVSASQEDQRRQGHDLEQYWLRVGHDGSGVSAQRVGLSPPSPPCWDRRSLTSSWSHHFRGEGAPSAHFPRTTSLENERPHVLREICVSFLGIRDPLKLDPREDT